MKTNFLIAFICYVLLAYEFIYHRNIIGHDYMFFLILTLFGIGGYNIGLGIGKIINKN